MKGGIIIVSDKSDPFSSHSMVNYEVGRFGNPSSCKAKLTVIFSSVVPRRQLGDRALVGS